MKKCKPYIILIVFAIVIVSFLFFTAFKDKFTKPSLEQTEISDRVEQLYSGEVQSIRSSGDDYIISFEKNHSIYEVTSNRQDGQFSNLLLVHKTAAEELSSETNAPNEENTTSAPEQAKLSEQKIIAIVKKQFVGEIDDIEYNHAADGGYYLVDIENAEGNEATFQIHAITGKVLSISFDD